MPCPLGLRGQRLPRQGTYGGRAELQEPAITPELIAAHGLKPDEYERILEIIGRELAPALR